MELDDRKQKVLRAIVDDYIATAEPVGSRTIARKYNLGVSPATIRNEMADLEELGLIEQPYTSAGRVPSDLGYRFYVDWLMERRELGEAERSYVYQRYARRLQQMEEVVRQTGELLSEITSYTALVLGPQWSNSSCKLVQLVYLETGRALLMVVNDAGLVHHRKVKIPTSITEKDLQFISEALNAKVQGMPWQKLRVSILDEILLELFQEREWLEQVIEIFIEVISSHEDNKLYLGGALNIFEQPEFKDLNKLKMIMSLLEEGTLLRNVLLEGLPERLTIRIGGENKIQEIQECSVVMATYSVDGEVAGTIGLLGPTRMDYARVLAAVEYIARNLSQVLTNLTK